MTTPKINRDFYLAKAMSDNTRLAYDKAWVWVCEVAGGERAALAMDAAALADVVIALATSPRGARGRPLSLGSVTLCVSAVNARFRELGKSNITNAPVVLNVMRGLRKSIRQPTRQASAQWRSCPMSGVLLGLDYAGLRAAAAMMNIATDADLFTRVRVLEAETLRLERLGNSVEK